MPPERGHSVGSDYWGTSQRAAARSRRTPHRPNNPRGSSPALAHRRRRGCSNLDFGHRARGIGRSTRRPPCGDRVRVRVGPLGIVVRGRSRRTPFRLGRRVGAVGSHPHRRRASAHSVPRASRIHHQPRGDKFAAPEPVRLGLDPQGRFPFIVGCTVRALADDEPQDSGAQGLRESTVPIRHDTRCSRRGVVPRGWRQGQACRILRSVRPIGARPVCRRGRVVSRVRRAGIETGGDHGLPPFRASMSRRRSATSNRRRVSSFTDRSSPRVRRLSIVPGETPSSRPAS